MIATRQITTVRRPLELSCFELGIGGERLLLGTADSDSVGTFVDNEAFSAAEGGSVEGSVRGMPVLRTVGSAPATDSGTTEGNDPAAGVLNEFTEGVEGSEGVGDCSDDVTTLSEVTIGAAEEEDCVPVPSSLCSPYS